MTNATQKAKEMLASNLLTQASLMRKNAQIEIEIYGENNHSFKQQMRANAIENRALDIQQEINP